MANDQTTYNMSQIMITLASISYAPSDQIGSYLQDKSYATQGNWELVWGPCEYIHDILYTDNLVYVARNSSTQEYAVVIRGSVLTFSESTIIDLFEDLEVDVTTPPPFSGPPSDAWIALGTCTGLDIISKFTDPTSGQTLVEYLSSQTLSTLYVTGHSLGGCLTTVLAPYLLANLNSESFTIAPYLFAAPTAGNAAYATWYDQTFTEANRCYNTIDSIPMAWNDLKGITALFPGGPNCPWFLKLILDAKADFLKDLGYDYTQPTGTINTFTGKKIAPPTKDWYTEMANQHNHATYLVGLGAPPVGLPTVMTVKPIQRNLEKEAQFHPVVTEL